MPTLSSPISLAFNFKCHCKKLHAVSLHVERGRKINEKNIEGTLIGKGLKGEETLALAPFSPRFSPRFQISHHRLNAWSRLKRSASVKFSTEAHTINSAVWQVPYDPLRMRTAIPLASGSHETHQHGIAPGSVYFFGEIGSI